MDKRKGIILAIVLFLFVGLGTYVFAGGSEDLANGQGNDTTNSSNDNDDKNNGQNTPNDETEEGENEGEGGNSRPVNGNSNSGSNLVINGDEEPGDNQNIGNADDAYKDVLALIENLENQIEQATKKSNLTDALEYRDNEKVQEKLDSLTDGEAKNDLKERLDKINSILEDNEAPVIAGIKDKEVTNDNVSITINEANVTILLNNKEVTIDELKSIEEEGNYKLEVIDKSFNSTEITFTIDKTLPTANVKNGEHFDSEKEIVFSDDNLSKVVVENRDKLHNNEEYITEYTNVENGNINVTLSEDATYLIKVYDKAGNEKSYWVAIDSNSAEITFLDKEENELSTLTNKDVTIKVYDKFLTEVTIEGPNGTETYKYTDKKDEYFEALNNNEERIFKLTVTEDGTYIVTAKDKVGHSVTEVIEIDQTPAKVDVSYDITELTNKGITVTLSSDEEIMPVDAGLWNPDKKYANKLQKVYFNNTDETITIVDKAGNETKVSIKITNYDKEAPKNNAVNFLINGINPEKEEINGKVYSVYYGTLSDELYGYIRTNEELKENPTFTLTYGTKEINLSGDDVELRIEDKEEYKYLYYFKYEINEEEFSKIAKEEIVMTVSNIVDLAGNKVEGTWEVLNSNRVFVDTVAPEYQTLRLTNVSRKDENGKWLQVASVGDIVRIIVTFDENPVVNPTLTINDEEVGQMKYDSQMKSYTYNYEVTENTKNGLMQIEISNYADAVGNIGTTLTNKNITSSDQNEMLVDTVNPEVVFANTHNYNKYYDIDELSITIKDENLSEVYYTWNNTDKYVNATTKLDEKYIIDNEDGTYTVKIPTVEGRKRLHIRAIDIAGNETTDYSSSGAYNIDKTDPVITLYYWFDDGNHKVIEPSVHNYCVFAEATDTNMKSITLNGKEYKNGELICDTDVYELKAVDKANHEVPINFEVDRTYGTITINDTDKYNTYDVTTIHKYNKIKSIEFSESGTVRLTKDNEIVYFGNDTDFAYDFTDGIYKLELIDKGGNNTVLMFEFDKTAPQVKELRINSSNENKQYANETHSVGIYLTVDEKLAKDPIFKINGIEYTEYRQGDADKFQYFLVTKLPENTKEGELEFTIEVEDEFGNTKTFTNKDILNDVGYDKVIFDTTAPELILAGTEETYDRVLRIESGTPLTLKDITAKATDASFGEAVNVEPYKVTFYNNIDPGKDYDFSNGLDTQKPSGNRYHVYYRVTDYAGNTTEDVMLVVMSDTTPATITPNQKDNLHVEVGSEYNHVTATVTDNVDETQIIEPWEYIRFDFQLNNTFEVYKNINTLIPGKYLAIWDYTDSSGNPSTTLKRWVNVTDTTAPVVKGVSSNTTYFGSIDFEMTDNSGKFIIYYDYDHNYQSCDDLMNGEHEVFTDTTNPFKGPFFITEDIDNVSVCVVDDSDNKTFFNNINLRKEANNETILNAIENGGTIVLPENTTINVSTNINIPEGTTIIGNDTTKLEGQLELKNSNITLKNINIYDEGSVILINKNLENIVIDGGNYITNNVGNQGMGAIRLDGISNGFEYTNDIIIKNANIQGAIHLLNYSGSLKNISNNTITLTNNDGVSPLAGILVVTDKMTDLDAEALLNNQTKVNVNYSLNSKGEISYYTAIQDLNWKNVSAVEVTK